MSKTVLTALVAGEPRRFEFSASAAFDLTALMQVIANRPGGVVLSEGPVNGTLRDTLLSTASQPVLECPLLDRPESDLPARVASMVSELETHGSLFFTEVGWDLRG